jgi:hypothetical protein
MITLSEELAALPHPERMARLMNEGRQASQGGASREALRAMACGEVFERWMAIKGCYTSRDGALVLAGVRDPSRSIRGASRKLVALACDDAQALAALRETFATRQHHKMLGSLRKRRRFAPIDAFLDWLRDQPGETLFCDVVPFGSTAAIERHLPRALERAGFVFWDRMRRHAPAPLARLLLLQVSALPGHPDSRLRWQLDQSLPVIARSAPDETIPLWSALRARGVPMPAQTQETLLRLRPAVMVDAMLASEGRLLSGCFSAVAPELGLARLLRVVALDPDLLGSPGEWLLKLPPRDREPLALAWSAGIEHRPRTGLALLPHLPDPARRERTYLAWSRAAQNEDGVIARDTVDQLPRDLAEREARRHLTSVTQLATRPWVRLSYAALLPWEEALSTLRDHMGHPDGDTRGPAVSSLLQVAGRRPERPELIDEALGMVKARKNEQDPVRTLMVGALLGWPREVWRASHLAAAGQIVRDGLDAADLSHATAALLEQLVLRLFRLDGAWGAGWLTTLARERGRINSSRLGDLLEDDEVRACAGPLLTLARTWAAQERDGHLMNLVRSLGARVTLVTGLPELLEEMVLTAPLASPPHGILTIFFQHDRGRYDRVLPAVLARWEGTVSGDHTTLSLAEAVREINDALLAAVVRVAERATSASTVERAMRVLRERRYPAFLEVGPRLLQRDPSYILAPSLLWLAHRRRQDLLTPYLRGDAVQGRLATGKTGWVLPLTAGFERWSPAQRALYARLLGSICADHERDTPTIRWTIFRLQSLAYTGGEQLLGLATDDRAAIQEMAVRALSRLDAGQGIPTLLACMEDARARIAIYALRKAILEMPPATAVVVLQQIPLRKITVAKEVARLLGELRSEEAYQALLGVARAVTHRDVQVALLRALWDHLEREETWVLLREAALGKDWILASRVGDIPPDRLSDRSERRLSELLALVLDRPEPEARIELLRKAHALPIRDHARHFYRQCLARMSSRYDDEIDAAVSAAVARATEADIDALAEATREISLHRKVLQRTLLRLSSLAQHSSVAREASRRALAMMADDALLVGLHAQIAARVLTPAELLASLDRIAARGWLDEFPLAAQAPLGELGPAALDAFEEALHDRPHYALRLAALAALQKQAAARGWTPQLRDRLAAYQADPSPRVAVAAQFIFPPSEEPLAPPARTATT